MQRNALESTGQMMVAMFRNGTTDLLNAALGTDAAREPLQIDDETGSLLASLLTMANASSDVAKGVVLIVGGAALALVPKKALEVKTFELQLSDGGDGDEENVQTVARLSGLNLTDVEGGQPFRYTRNGTVVHPETHEELEIVRVDKARMIQRPRIPGVDKAPAVLPRDQHLTPVAAATMKTTVTGARLFSAGVTTVLRGAYDGVTGATNAVATGGQQLYKAFRGSGN